MNALEQLGHLSWPPSSIGEAMAALASARGLSATAAEGKLALPADAGENEELRGRWIEDLAASMGLQAEATEFSCGECERVLRCAGPALFQLHGDGESRFLALLDGGKKTARLIGPNLKPQRVEAELIRSALSEHLEKPLQTQAEALLERAGIGASNRPEARAALLREQLSSKRISGCWMLLDTRQGTLLQQARRAGLGKWLMALGAAHTIQFLLWLASWWLIGMTALQGRFDRGWLIAWALLLLGLVPFRMFVTWSQGTLAVRAGALIKQHLLYGALRLKPEDIRREGAGQLLGRVIESEAVESLAMSGGILGLAAVIELALAGVVLALGVTGWVHVVLLFGWLALIGSLSWLYFSRRENWTKTRLTLTNDLVERMVGHRTRLAQQAPERWHDGEDESVRDYLDVAAAMDRKTVLLMALGPRGWLLVSIGALAPSFTSASAAPATVAVALGGIFLVFRALQKLVVSLSHLAGAAIACRQITPFLRAAKRSEGNSSPGILLHPSSNAKALVSGVIQAHDLRFTYRDRGEAILRGCNLTIETGTRVLLEGPSGSGKSTLASLLAGMRSPDAGLLLLHGLDQHTVGVSNWRREVVVAPQFHENHVLTGTFLFNLLFGSRWPPQAEDFATAEKICDELGLSELLKRMPAGLLQMVGETGWQLSQGEKSRLYIARALLQNPGLVILDESFASLDPVNMRRALQCVLNRARTLLVIAHR